MRFYRDLDYEQLVELWRREELKRRASRPTVLFHNQFTPEVQQYRWYADDDTEDASTSLANESASYDVDVSAGNVQLQLRLLVEEAGDDTSDTNLTCQLRYDKNTLGVQNVTGGSSNILSTADANSPLTDNDLTTNRSTDGLTDEEGSFVNGPSKQEVGDGAISSGDPSPFALSAGNFGEPVWGITVIADDVADGDSITFDITLDGTPVTMNVTPTLTVTKTAAAPTGTLSGEIQALSMTAAGEQQFLATGDFQGQPAELAASAHMVPEGTADLAMQDMALDADGVQAVVGTGNMESQIAELAANGVMPATGALSAIAEQPTITTSDLAAPIGVMDLVLTDNKVFYGAEQAFYGSEPAIYGYGSPFSLVAAGIGDEFAEGQLDLVESVLTMTAAGVMQPAGTGDIEIQIAALNADGVEIFVGTASFESQIAEIDFTGEAAESPAGVGDFEAQLLELDAAGVMQPSGTGNLETQDAELDADGSTAEFVGTATFERLTNP